MHWSALAVLPLLTCAAAAKERPYSPPRLDNGQPDMQGVWVASNSTPLQRQAGFTTLVIDEGQAAKLLATLDARAEDRTTPTEPTEYFEDLSIEPIRGQLRSSLIVEPTDGLLPGNDLYKQHIVPAMASVLNAMDGPEQRPAPERCLASTTVQPPILSIRNGVNLHQIVQTADSFVFTSEFVNAARIVRLNAKPLPPAITSWLGDSVGRWEGDVLVVVTRGFTQNDYLRLSPNASRASPRIGSTTRSWSRIRPITRSHGRASRISCVATNRYSSTPATRQTIPWCTSWRARASANVASDTATERIRRKPKRAVRVAVRSAPAHRAARAETPLGCLAERHDAAA
jgi:hypothetical protein